MAVSNTIENQSGKVLQITPRVRLPLGNIGQCRKEAASVYRQMKSGVLPTSEGTRLLYGLQVIAKMIEVESLEIRLSELEKQNGND
jgi:hypothetical protein